MKTLIIIISVLTLNFNGVSDVIICESVPLSSYGFSGGENEIVCSNIINSSDFTIINKNDYKENINNGTLLKIEFENKTDIKKLEVLD